MNNDSVILNSRNKFGSGLAHYLAGYGDVVGLRRMAQATNNPTLLAPLNQAHQTPLHIAATGNSYACVEHLIRVWPLQLRCVDVNMKNPIHLVNNTEALMAFEAYFPLELTTINAIDGSSLVHYAAERGNAEVIAYLLKRGHQVNTLKNFKGETWDSIATSKTRDRVTALLTPRYQTKV
jgi:ankyrin repeat protein